MLTLCVGAAGCFVPAVQPVSQDDVRSRFIAGRTYAVTSTLAYLIDSGFPWDGQDDIHWRLFLITAEQERQRLWWAIPVPAGTAVRIDGYVRVVNRGLGHDFAGYTGPQTAAIATIVGGQHDGTRCFIWPDLLGAPDPLEQPDLLEDVGR